MTLTMKFKRAALAALAAVFILSAAGCSKFFKLNEDKVNATIVAKLGDREFTLEEFNASYQVVINNYAAYGIDLTSDAYADLNKSTREDYLGQFVSAHVEQQKIQELGLDVFTPEEEAEMQAEAEANYQANYDDVYSQFEGIGETNPATATDSFLAEYGYTVEAELESVRLRWSFQKLQDYIYSSVEITEEDLRDYYDRTIVEMQSNYAENSDMFCNYWNNNVIMLTRLDGYTCYLWINTLEKDKAEEALAKLNEGADFAEVTLEYGNGEYQYPDAKPPQSMGVILSPTMTSSTPEAVLTAALALEKDGDMTGVVETDEDGYFIVKRVGAVEGGDMSFEEAKEMPELMNIALEEKQEGVYDEQVAQWVIESGAEMYPDKVNTGS